MPDIDLDKLSPELRAALERELKPRPARQDTIGVNFVYDPDDEQSVTKGYERGHLTDDDLVSWGYNALLEKIKKLRVTDDDKGKGKGGTDDDDDDRDRGPNRRGYFGG